MNTKQRWTLAGAGLAIATALAFWAATGFHIFTKQQIAITEVDEFLGTETIVWKDVFIVGLDIAGTVIAAAVVLGGLLYWSFRTRVARV